MKRIIRLLFYILIFLGLMCLFLQIFGTVRKHELHLYVMTDEVSKSSPIEVFYIPYSSDDDFTQERSLQAFEDKKEYTLREYVFRLPNEDIKDIRIDFGSRANKKVVFARLEYIEGSAVKGYTDKVLTANNAEIYQTHELQRTDRLENGETVFNTTGTDPYIIIRDIHSLPDSNTESADIYFYLLISAVLSLTVTVVLYKYVHLRRIAAAVADTLAQKKLIFSLAKNDFKTRFAGSYFGIIWAFVQPVCTILVFWFVFQIGFRNPNVGNVPYVLWFMAGLIPWFFFSEAWNGATNAFIEYSYLVKKVVFKINILPMIKIISSLFVHLFFVVFMMVCFMLYQQIPMVSWIQVFYYMLCMIVLVGVLSFITAPLVIFFRDISQIMSIILQFGMWLTPIMWSVDSLPAGMGPLINIFKLNPMFYIVQGYRNSMIYGVPFWHNSLQTVYFWSLILVLAVIGGHIYTKLKPHFSDIL